jgi:hypothetical protein
MLVAIVLVAAEFYGRLRWESRLAEQPRASLSRLQLQLITLNWMAAALLASHANLLSVNFNDEKFPAKVSPDQEVNLLEANCFIIYE